MGILYGLEVKIFEKLSEEDKNSYLTNCQVSDGLLEKYTCN